MRRWVVTLALALVLAAGMVVALGLFALRGGVSARSEPSSLEAAVARRIRHVAIPRSDRALRNPAGDTSAAVAGGLAHFADHCAVCHGNDGKGKTAFGQGLYPRPPDLTASPTQSLSDGELFSIIENGVRFTGMPAFGTSEGPSDLSWHLVTFIRHLPALTDEELHEMERLNPRPASEWKELEEEDEFLKGPSTSAPTSAP